MNTTPTTETSGARYQPRPPTKKKEINRELSDKSTQLILEIIEHTNHFLETQQKLNSTMLSATKIYLSSNSKRQQFQRRIKGESK